MKNMKGQAAMEYLMTYGWALLVIAVVIAALFFLTQNMFRIEGCTFQPTGFSCGDSPPQIYADSAKNNNVAISIKIYNQFGQPIKLKHVACTSASVGEVKDSMKTSPKDLNGKTVTDLGAGSSVVLVTNCVDATNTPLSLTPGSQFKGNYIIWYNFNNDPNPNVPRQAVGTIAGPVLKK